MVELEVRAERMQFGAGVRLYVLHRDGAGLAVARNLVIERVTDGEIVEPTLQLHMNAAQALMDELWQCGLRPSEGSGSAGSLAATERHLKDMQAIAKGLLRKDGVEGLQ